MVKIKYIKLYKSNYTHTREREEKQRKTETETELQETQRWGEKEWNRDKSMQKLRFLFAHTINQKHLSSGSN